MATKSEWYRYETERSGPKKAKAPVRPRGRSDGTGPAPHNVSEHAARKASYALERSTGRPSRTSSRKAANRQKTDVQFRMKRNAAESRPPGR